jgi:hypothetical protein
MSVLVDWFSGEDITATNLNEMQPLNAYKPAQTSRASTTTLAADPNLAAPVVAAGVYEVECYLNYTGAAQGSGDLKFAFTGPSGATFTWSALGFAVSGGFTTPEMICNNTLTSTRQVGSNSGSTVDCWIKGSLIVSSTAGTLTLTWAQNTSSSTATVLSAGCWLRLIRVV